MSKDLWFAEMERLMSDGASYESACDRAHGSMMERLYDHADYMRKRAREDGATSPQRTPTPQAITIGESDAEHQDKT